MSCGPGFQLIIFMNKADGKLQIHALHFLSKLVMLLEVHITFDYVASAESSLCICILVYVPNVIYKMLCNIMCNTGSSCIQN